MVYRTAKERNQIVPGNNPGWRSRVKLVTERWRRKVEFSTPKAEKAIMGTLEAMQSLMDDPMVIDGKPQKNAQGQDISRRKFWRGTKPEEALSMISVDNIKELKSLEQLADVVFIARYDPQILNQVLHDPLFLEQVISVRDHNGNNLLHWAASADMPSKAIFGLSGALRKRLDEEDLDDHTAHRVRDTLRAENAMAVKLHELAFAMKDEGLATELMRAKHSVREKNRIGTDFVQEALQADGGEEYLEKLGEIAEKEELGDNTVQELKVTQEDFRVIKSMSAAEEILDDFLNGNGAIFKKRLKEAKESEPMAQQLFFHQTAEEDARNKGLFHFGRLDRDGNDWLPQIIQHGDLDMLELCLTVIERHAREIAEIFVRSRKDLDVDDLTLQLTRIYLKTGNVKGKTPFHHAILARKAIFLQRLLETGLFKPYQIASARSPARKRDMLEKNMQLMVGKRMQENLFLQVALSETPQKVTDEDAALTNIMKMLEVLFEQLTQNQGYALFQMNYQIGKPPRVRKMNFFDLISRHDKVLSRVKEAFQVYAEAYMMPDY